MTHRAVPVTELKPHPRNVRQGDIGLITESLREHGQYRPIVVQTGTNLILAGNHTYKAACALKWKTIEATFVDCDDDQALRILLMDNRANDVANYDDHALVEMLKEMMGTELKLDATGFDPSDLDDLLRDLELETGNPITGDPDEVPDDAPAITVTGDVWLLGHHRLMCGNSLNITDLDKLMNGQKVDIVHTDPPYGINLDTDYSQGGAFKGRKYKPVINDDKPFDASILYAYLQDAEEQFWWGADYYRRTIDDSELSGSWFVWDKRVEEAKDKLIGSAFELCWSRNRHQRKILRYQWTNWTSQYNAGLKRVHPTEKPVAMIEELLSHYSDEHNIVVDPFGGSGSTLIACERAGRTAYLMELDPHYCDIICKRFQQITGITPIAEATGNPHTFL